LRRRFRYFAAVKVKQRDEDFRVEEVSRVEAGVAGDFTLYRLEKSGIGTPEALRLVARAWRLAPRAIAFAGLKDRYGRTGQVISIRRGPARNYEGRGFKLNYLGRAERPASRGTIERNEFRITLRDLGPDEADRVAARAAACASTGFPNYYDDQRFGSLRGTHGQFVARALLDGDAEGALRLAIASPARADRSRLKARRRLLKERWGRWEELRDRLPPSLERRICARLADGAPFPEAYGLLDAPLRQLHLSTLQAHLFNACLRRAVGPGGPRHPGADGPYLFPPEGAAEGLRGLRLPLASAKAPPHPLLDAVLAAEGLDREDLAGLPFRAGARDALVVPAGLRADAPVADALNPGRVALTLSFALPPGAYATMLVKSATWDL